MSTRPTWEVYESKSRNSMGFATRRAAFEFVKRQFTPEQARSMSIGRDDGTTYRVIRDFGRKPLA